MPITDHTQTNGTESKWKEGVEGLLGTSEQFYPTKSFGSDDGSVLVEITCESIEKCDRNQRTFKAYFSSWLAWATLIVPGISDTIMPKLQTSAVAATSTCVKDGTLCGIQWYKKTSDGTDGLEQQMAVLGVLNANMVPLKNKSPFSANNGGTSKSNPNAGTNSSDTNTLITKPITTGDRAGAGILTVIFVTGWVVAVTWMIRGG